MELDKQRKVKIADFVAELLEKCGDVLDPDILAAAKKGGVDAVSRRLEHVLPDSERGETRLVQASRLGKVEAVGMFLSCGANTESGDFFGNTPLICAATCGQVLVTHRLLKAKAAVDAKNRSGCTALWSACCYGNAAVVKALLDGGADLNMTGQGMSALYVASRSGVKCQKSLYTLV